MFKNLNDRNDFGYANQFNQLKNSIQNVFNGGRAYYCGFIHGRQGTTYSNITSLTKEDNLYYIYNVWQDDSNINFVKCKNIWCGTGKYYSERAATIWFSDENNIGYGVGYNRYSYWAGCGNTSQSINSFQALSVSNVKFVKFANSYFHSAAMSDPTYYTYCCGLTNEGKLYYWGNKNSSPIYVAMSITIVDIAGSDQNKVLLLSEEGDVYVYTLGYNFENGSTKIMFPNNKKCKQIAASLNCFFALTEDGQLYGWGSNNRGELGLGHTNNVASPTLIGDKLRFKSVSAAGWHMVCQELNGDIYGCGSNDYGQLAIKDTSIITVNILTKIQNNINQKKVVAGYNSTAIIDNIGCVFCVGRSHKGTIINGYTGNVYEWRKLSNKKGIRDIFMSDIVFVLLTQEFEK